MDMDFSPEDLAFREEVRAFLANESPDKRATKIEELLLHPGHADLCPLFGRRW